MKPPLDDGYRLLAAQYLRKQIRQLAAQIEGIRQAEDIEYVHRARVASRRLRAALNMFADCFRARKVKRWRKQIRRVTRDLGEVRDKDVQIVWVRQALGELGPQDGFPGIARLLMHLELQRDALQPEVVAALDRLEQSRVLKKMASKLKRIASGLEARGATVQSPFALCRAQAQILAQLDELLNLQQSLDHAEDVQQHHALRIALKRLRYTMEACRPLYGPPFADILEAIKQLQTLLGELHDCDVWVQSLEDYLAEEQRRIEACYGHSGPLARWKVGIEALRENRQSQRQQVFQRLVNCWRASSAQGLWERLRELVRAEPSRAACDSPAVPQPPAPLSTFARE